MDRSPSLYDHRWPGVVIDQPGQPPNQESRKRVRTEFESETDVDGSQPVMVLA